MGHNLAEHLKSRQSETIQHHFLPLFLYLKVQLGIIWLRTGTAEVNWFSFEVCVHYNTTALTHSTIPFDYKVLMFRQGGGGGVCNVCVFNSLFYRYSWDQDVQVNLLPLYVYISHISMLAMLPVGRPVCSHCPCSEMSLPALYLIIGSCIDML